MQKEMRLRILNRLLLFYIINIVFFLILFLIPINDNNFSICLFKNITGKECFNCGMTRAFLSIVHLNFKQAIGYNKNVVIIFPMTVTIYLYSWYKYIYKVTNYNESYNKYKCKVRYKKIK